MARKIGMRGLSSAALSFCIALASGGAGNADEAAVSHETPFKTFEAKCGYPVVWERTSHVSKAEIDPVEGPRIVLDPSLRTADQSFHRIFLIAHECAHHLMEHTTEEGITFRMTRRHGVRDHELSADCWASEELTRNGHLPQLLNLADAFWRRGFVSPGQGYPSGIQRSNVIRHCAQIAAKQMRRDFEMAGAQNARRDHHP